MFEHGEVGSATDGSERVRQGGGAMSTTRREGEKRGFRGGRHPLITRCLCRPPACADLVRQSASVTEPLTNILRVFYVFKIDLAYEFVFNLGCADIAVERRDVIHELFR